MRFSALTTFEAPALHIWNEHTDFVSDLRPVSVAESGWAEFLYDGAEPLSERTRFMLFNRIVGPHRSVRDEYETSAHIRHLMTAPDGAFPDHVWFVQGSARVVRVDPATAEQNSVRIHLLTASRYRESELYIWDLGGRSERLSQSGRDATGP